VTCDTGVRRRTRQCLSFGNNGIVGSGCEGPATGEEPCELVSCGCKCEVTNTLLYSCVKGKTNLMPLNLLFIQYSFITHYSTCFGH